MCFFDFLYLVFCVVFCVFFDFLFLWFCGFVVFYSVFFVVFVFFAFLLLCVFSMFYINQQLICKKRNPVLESICYYSE